MDPVEPVLGPFLYPDMPQKGDQFQAQVRHLWTPNEVNAVRMILETQYCDLKDQILPVLCVFAVLLAFTHNYIFKQIEVNWL